MSATRARLSASVVALVLLLGTLGCPDSPRKAADAGVPKAREIVALVTVEGLGAAWNQAAPPDAAPVLRSLPGRDAPAMFTPCPSLVPAVASLMSGVAPAVHGVLDNFSHRVPDAQPLLAERLRSAGWRTAAFVANPILGRVTALDRGFDVFDGSTANVLASARYYPEVRPAAGLVDDALVWLSALPQGERAFLWLHLADLGEPKLSGGEGPPPGVRERLDAVDRAVGRLREAVRSGGNQGVFLVAGDRGQAPDPAGDPGQGFFLDPTAVTVFYAEESFGGFQLPDAARPRVLSELHDRILRIAALATPSPTGQAPEDSTRAVVVSSSAIPWIWCRWPATVVVAQRGSLWIYDGEWRRSEDLRDSAPCSEADVPAEALALARAEIARLQSIPPAGPRLQALLASRHQAGLPLVEEVHVAHAPSPLERRRAVAQVQRARWLAAIGQYDPAVESLAGLRSGSQPLLAAMVDSLMYAALNPRANGRDWTLATQTLARFGTLPAALHWTAHAALHRKNPQLAEKLLQAFLERVPADADALYDLACIRSMSGDMAGTEAMLRAAADSGFRAWDYVEVDADLRNFRADPRYAQFRKSIGR